MKKKKGFTLVELIAVIGITVIFGAIVLGISIKSVKLFSMTQYQSVGTKYKCSFSTADEVRTLVKEHLLDDDSSNKPDGVSDPSDFNLCKQSTSEYSMGIYINWNADGFYEIETWCWDTNKGESSLINRKTYVTPR